MTKGKKYKSGQTITAIEQLSRPECLECWREVFGKPPPKYLSPQFLKRVLIWELQTKLHAIHQTNQCLKLVQRVDLSPGVLMVRLNPNELAAALECEATRFNTDELTLTSPFRTRRRGVELKLHLSEASPEIDQALVQNIVKAQKWLSMIIDGKTFTEIAEADGTSKRRVQDIVDVATLAPDILDAIARGEQPDSLTSDYMIKSGIPISWAHQRAQFAKL